METADQIAQIADHFEAFIRQGRIMPGYKLPSADQIMIEFRVPQRVAREALRELQRRGVAVIRGRVGTFAA